MGKDLPYAKLVTALFDSGLWARMSAAARALYPALLRFSDGQFKPVFPGTTVLLKLTGFKQKSTLRKAREELVELGLITVSRGNGRKNSYYHFRMDWACSPEGHAAAPQGGVSAPRRGAGGPAAGALRVGQPYNHVHISITNNPAGVPLAHDATPEAEQKRLYPTVEGKRASWSEIEKALAGQISASSLRMMKEALLSTENDLYIFSDSLPEHLKALLEQVCSRVYFANDLLISRNPAGADSWNP
ncbi:MAG: helix-turn-helix domain-containing protein [Spirochaetales bacterium]|nr:helix-turn-helix domain-containing protein [Spirochaetales bacterium]